MTNKTDRAHNELTDENLDQVAGGWANYIAVRKLADAQQAADGMSNIKTTRSEAEAKAKILD